MALVLGYVAGAATEYLSWPCDLKPGAMSGLIVYMEQETAAIGDASANGAAIFAVSNAAVTSGPYLQIYALSVGGVSTIGHDNDVSAIAVSVSPAPTVAQLVQLRWVLNSTGSVQIWQSINGAAETTSGVSATLALGSIWGTTGSPAKYWLNSIGTGGLAYGYAEFQGVVVMRGVQTKATLLRALAY